ncbi:hypothetical protein SNN68_003888 [Cronobacter sakazakii]|nr:hypothetical protein [Cronobacter sakazakii]
MNTAKLKAAAEKAKDDFLPNVTISTRDVLELIAALEAAEKRVAELERQAIQPLPIGELINRLEEQTGEPWGEVYLAGINLRRGGGE